MHSLVPNCQILEFQNAKFGQDTDDDDWEVWFRNKHYAVMRQQLIHNTLDAWDDCLPDLEPITCDADKEKAMFNYVEIFRPLFRPCKLNLHTRISTISSKRNWVETLSCSQRNPTNFLPWWIR